MDVDKKMDAVIRHIVKTDIGDLLAQELKIRFEGIQRQIDLIQQSNDSIATQIKEDREDINQNTIDLSTIKSKLGVMISNDIHQEEKVVLAVEEATQKIPEQVKESVQETLKEKSFIDKILRR